MAPREPNMLLLFALCFAGAAALIGLFKLNHWLVTRKDVKRSEPQTPTPPVMSRAEEPARPFVSALPGTGTGPGTTPVLSSNLTEDQLLLFLATQKNAMGKWRFSGKSLYSLLGGNHNTFLQKMREIRGEGPAEERPDDIILTPIAGRATRASYYPDDPDLEFKSPPS